eukprot:CAMPEP_0195538538 /NCGR_PEP_ID=MMETSP0794_2-20130614/49584_1 /TAXON_ID=515487 /ORGANISM="Stephanopyxis turris, Strain CCMP 815" /LENGTH=483 /DNA_ID=CAMNT_0040672529 /DNA_START=23 /DNA_END=1474 /DNA_ORIENTATION=-
MSMFRKSNEASTAPSVAESDASSTSSSSLSWEECEDVEIITGPVEAHTGHKKVLVTGGAGFIGSNVAEYLLARGDDVVIVDEMNDYYDLRIKESNLSLLQNKYGKAGRLAVYRGDICDEAFMMDLFEKERPEWVCHMAARAGVRPSIADPFVYIHSNIRGTTQLMELSHRFGVKNFVFASSSSVYGGSKNTYFSEDENVDNPVSPYAASKKACELLAYTYHHLYNLNVSALRFFTVYGPRGRPDMAPFKFIDRVSRGLEIQQFGDGSSSRDYTYISDEDENVDNPVSPYAASKKACELLAYTYHHLYNLNVSALRFFTVYGPRGRPDMAPFKFIDRVSRGLEIQQFGDGSSSRDYTYISDIVDGVVRAIDRPRGYEVYNLGKGDGTSLKEFIDLVQKHTGKTANIRQLPDQPGDVPYTCADISKARRILGYEAKISFEEGIRRTASWYREAYEDNTLEVCPEMQANGMGRAPSCVNLSSLKVN